MSGDRRRVFRARDRALALGALACMLWCGGVEVRAGIVVNVQQVDADVVATLTGSFNTAVAASGTTAYYQDPPAVIGGGSGNNGFFFSNAFIPAGRVWSTTNVSAPFTTFGSGAEILTNASSSSISANNVWVQFLSTSELYGVFTIAPSYAGGALNDSMTFTSKTMSQLGLGNYGTYVFTYGTGGTTDTVTVNLITSVPEPSTVAMALAGLACGGFSVWRRRRRA